MKTNIDGTITGGVFLYTTTRTNIGAFQRLLPSNSEYHFLFHNTKNVALAPFDKLETSVLKGSFFLGTTGDINILPVTQRSATIYGATFNYSDAEISDELVAKYGKSVLGGGNFNPEIPSELLPKILYALDSKDKKYKDAVDETFVDVCSEYNSTLVFGKSGLNSNLIILSDTYHYDLPTFTFYLVSYFGASVLIWTTESIEQIKDRAPNGMQFEVIGSPYSLDGSNTTKAVTIFPRALSTQWVRWFAAIRNQENSKHILLQKLRETLDL